jgi:hypothetical protein
VSLLTLVQNACDEVGLSQPATVIGNQNTVAKRCLRFAVRTGRDLVRQNIPYLFKEYTFNTVASQQAYTLPSDFDHFVPFTHWNRTTDRRQYPIQPSEWQLYQSGLASVSINDRFRIRGQDRDLLLDPTPSSAETVAFEYVSKNYCQDNGGVGQSVWQADTDTGVIDEEIFELGLIWRLLNRMGQPYAEEKAEYQRSLNTMSAQILQQKVFMDGHQPAVSNLPDANFPSS